MWDFFSVEVSGRRKGLSPVQFRYQQIPVQQNWTAHSDLQTLCNPISCGVFILLSLHPPPQVDNHNSCLFFLHSFSCPATALARKSLSWLSLRGHPNSKVEAKVLQELFLQVFACVITGDTLREREREKAVWKHAGRERNLIYYHQKEKLTADVCSQILPLPPIMETHAKICSASQVFFFMHTFTNTQINFSPRFTYLYMLTQLHTQALRR